MGTGNTEVVNRYDDNGTNYVSLRLPVVCPSEHANTKTNKSPPTQADLLSKQVKASFRQKAAANVEMHSACYLDERHNIVDIKEPFDSLVQTAVLRLLVHTSFSSVIMRK